MPIVINELVVTANVTSKKTQTATNSKGNRQQAAEKQELIEACVEEVLTILQQQQER